MRSLRLNFCIIFRQIFSSREKISESLSSIGICTCLISFNHSIKSGFFTKNRSTNGRSYLTIIFTFMTNRIIDTSFNIDCISANHKQRKLFHIIDRKLNSQAGRKKSSIQLNKFSSRKSIQQRSFTVESRPSGSIRQQRDNHIFYRSTQSLRIYYTSISLVGVRRALKGDAEYNPQICILYMK